LRNKQKIMVNTIPITKARHNLGQIVKRVMRDKEYFILEKDGIPVLGVMSADELEDYLELQDPKVQRTIAKSTQEFRAGKSRPAREFLAELQGAAQKKSKRRAKV
jgi:prevent-host-death family protein